MEHIGKQKLMERLDECLIDHAEGLCAWGTPSIQTLYQFQGLTEMHCFLKTAHIFDAAEVEALLRFADPLEVAAACWEENTHEYSFPICELMQKIHADERFPLAEPEPPQRPSIREQLAAAMREARRQPTPTPEKDRGGDAR